MTSPSPNPAVVADFLRRLADDRDAGRAVPLAAYQAAYPGDEALIAEEYTRALSPAPVAGTARPTPDPTAGGRIGRFEVVRPLGRGGQGEVVEALDPALGRRVALKLLTGLTLSADDLARFRREAETASRLDDPSICSVLEADLDAWPPYIAMPLVEGETLHAVLTRARLDGSRADAPLPLPPRGREELGRTLRYFARVADALEVAHRAGVVHRDVKPGNLMVTPAGAPVVLDFGLAAALSGDQPTLTRTGDLFGTPAYMAPEQIDPEVGPVDGRTDVHALGVCLFEALTLGLPYSGVTRDGLYHEILTRTAPDLRRLSRSLPADLAVVVATALAKDPDHRYASAERLAEDLRAIVELRPIRARPVNAVARAVRWARREPATARLVLGVVTLTVLLLFAAGYLAARRADFAAAARERDRRELAERVEERLERGFFLLEESRPGDALVPFGEARRLGGGAEEDALCGQVIALLRAGHGEAALELLERAGELGPAARRARAAALRMVGRIDESDRALERLGEPTEALDLLVAALFKTTDLPGLERDPAGAVALLTRAAFVADRPRALYHLERSRAAMAAGDVDAQLDSARALLAHHGDDPIVLTHLAQCFRDSDPERSRRLAETVVDARPDHVDAWTVLAGALCNLGRFEEASRAAARAVELVPAFGGAHALLAHARAMRGDLDGAVAAADAALALEPENEAAHAAKGLAKLRRGDARGALDHLERSIARRRDPGRLVLLGECHCRLGALDRGADAFREALELDPDSPTAETGLGVIAASRDLHDEAIRRFRRVLERRPDDAIAVANLLATFEQAGRPAATRTFLEGRVERRPASIVDRVRLARFLADPATPDALRDLDAAGAHAAEARRLWLESDERNGAVGEEIEALLAATDGSGEGRAGRTDGG
ncbi:MAG: protein kinase [Planctomycetota bacterium JB042]